jgi:hypothetical protein
LKKTLKTGAVALSLLLGTGIFAQTNVYAKETPGKVHDTKVKMLQTSDEDKNPLGKALSLGLSKNSNDTKSTLPPVIKQGGILIPVNAITKSFGAGLVWDNENQVVTITKGDVTIVINLIDKVATVNGVEVALQDDSISNNGTLVPLTFIAQNLGIDLAIIDAEQIIDEAQVSDSTQTSDSETGTSTDVQAPISTDVQVPTNTDVQVPTNTDVQTSIDNTIITDTQN